MTMIIFLFLSCFDYEKEYSWDKEEKPEKALLVGHTVAQINSVAEYLEITGTLEGIVQASILPPSSGTLIELHVEEGSIVEKEQVLANIQNHNIDASAQRASLDYQKSKTEFVRIENLYQKGAIAEREYRESRSALDIAKVGYLEAQKSKSQMQLLSPIAGTITTISAREGELVGSSPLLTIVDLSRLRLTAMVPEKELSFLKLQQETKIVSAYDNNSQTDGFISYISPVVEISSGSIKIFIDLEKDQTSLRAGQFVRARIKVDEHQNTLTIPKDALLYRDGQPIVYTFEQKKEDSDPNAENEKPDTAAKSDIQTEWVAKSIDVKVGYSDDKIIEILEGLELDTPIVTMGNTSLKDGSLVIIESKSQDNKEE